ncbi:hypothetical protein [Burkholderia ambifaria]|uniref:hypothetical protein n=1 Tax=Burkholderia ambifaria TaxID=152480 RepID=UPI00158EB0C6|nr:hypothetical protein [Burkholderia ambifaria]
MYHDAVMAHYSTDSREYHALVDARAYRKGWLAWMDTRKAKGNRRKFGFRDLRRRPAKGKQQKSSRPPGNQLSGQSRRSAVAAEVRELVKASRSSHTIDANRLDPNL